MYVPGSFKVDDEAQIEAFLRRYDFATLVSAPATGMVASHVPLLVRRAPEGLVLVGHVARANPHWRLMDGQGESMAIFQGPHGYVSPTWYASGPAVPTWNYTAVHAYGKPRVAADPTFARELLREMVAGYEEAWRIEDLPPPFTASLMAAIVAFEMPVDRLEAKFKLGQNRSAEDRAGTIAGLNRAATPEAAALAAFMAAQRAILP
jgi:transcriptional regulator